MGNMRKSLADIKLTCRQKYAVTPGRKPFFDGLKHCYRCQIYVRQDSYLCPCCSNPLRSKSRLTAAARRKLGESKRIE